MPPAAFAADRQEGMLGLINSPPIAPLPKISPKNRTKKMTDLTPLANLPAALLSAKPGALLRVELANGTVATIILSHVGPLSERHPQGRARLLSDRLYLITERLESGRANSPDGAALQIAREGLIPGPSTPESKATALAKMYRALHKTIRLNPTTTQQQRGIIESGLSEVALPTQNEKPALAPDALIPVRRRHLLLDLDGDDAKATYAQILAPAFWLSLTDKLNTSDVVTVLRADAPPIDCLIGPRHPDGGLFVDDCAVYGMPVPPLPSEAAA
jgi:hypothetical protein